MIIAVWVITVLLIAMTAHAMAGDEDKSLAADFDFDGIVKLVEELESSL